MEEQYQDQYSELPLDEVEPMIPDEAAKLIRERVVEMAADAMKKQAEAEAAAKRREELGKAAVEKEITEKLAVLPRWLDQYDVTWQQWAGRLDDVGHSIERGYNWGEVRMLFFDVPTLAGFQYDTRDKTFNVQRVNDPYHNGGWAEPFLQYYGQDDNLPTLADALVVARDRMNELHQAQQEKAQRDAVRQQEETLEETRAQDVEEERAVERAKEQAEINYLIDVVKNDSVVLLLLKAIVALTKEREAHTYAIEEQEGWLNDMAARHEETTAKLQRKVKDALDDAAEAHRERDDAQDDLRSLKKQQHHTW